MPNEPTPFAPALSRLFGRSKSSDVRDLLESAKQPGMISMAGGLPAAEFFDAPGFLAAAQTVLAGHPEEALQYGPTEGQAALRARLAALLAGRGIEADGADIVVTTGSQQAIDLFARALIDPGDLVALEAPTYLAALQVFDLLEPRYLHVPSTPHGLDVDWLAASGARPKLLYVVPSFANPTGSTLPLAQRVKLLHWAADNGVFVIEDDPYGEIRFAGSREPSLYALAQRDARLAPHVAYTSTLSKVLAPGLRLGWILAPLAVRRAAVRIKQALDLHTSSFAQEVAAAYLAGDGLGAAMARVQTAYGERAAALCDALESSFGTGLEFERPQGGMFVWARFTDGTDTRALLDVARRLGAIFVPGGAFYSDAAQGESRLRLSFATNPPAVLAEGVARLAQAHRMLHRAGPRAARELQA